MSLKKTVLLIISWAILGLAVFALLKVSRNPSIEQLRTGLSDKSAAVFGNLFQGLSPSRRPPLTTIESEESLKSILPVPFVKFSQDDWNWFWQLIYGSFTNGSDRGLRQKRQLTKEEIQQALVDNYYQPFGRFKKQQWDAFWQFGLKGRMF